MHDACPSIFVHMNKQHDRGHRIEIPEIPSLTVSACQWPSRDVSCMYLRHISPDHWCEDTAGFGLRPDCALGVEKTMSQSWCDKCVSRAKAAVLPHELSSVLAPFNRYGLVYTAFASKVTKVLARPCNPNSSIRLHAWEEIGEKRPKFSGASFLSSYHTRPGFQQPTHQLPAQASSNAIVPLADAMTDRPSCPDSLKEGFRRSTVDNRAASQKALEDLAKSRVAGRRSATILAQPYTIHRRNLLRLKCPLGSLRGQQRQLATGAVPATTAIPRTSACTRQRGSMTLAAETLATQPWR
ncbi:hypothetical protein DE146DRAFT_49995 [Phaeosphaeria sp. MPI-PUGE-AT-0046c]|nr:hypothetical protein DE146DRAFT_49995 [Phaeosphaeria sp. MPI-PUGE-AT-0046c]